MSRPLEKGRAKGAGWIPPRRYENEWETSDLRLQTSDFRPLKSLSLKRASPHIYLRRFPMMMRRTNPSYLQNLLNLFREESRDE